MYAKIIGLKPRGGNAGKFLTRIWNVCLYRKLATLRTSIVSCFTAIRCHIITVCQKEAIFARKTACRTRKKRSSLGLYSESRI